MRAPGASKLTNLGKANCPFVSRKVLGLFVESLGFEKSGTFYSFIHHQVKYFPKEVTDILYFKDAFSYLGLQIQARHVHEKRGRSPKL